MYISFLSVHIDYNKGKQFLEKLEVKDYGTVGVPSEIPPPDIQTDSSRIDEVSSHPIPQTAT